MRVSFRRETSHEGIETGDYQIVLVDAEENVFASIAVPFSQAHRLNQEIVTVLNKDDAEQAWREGQWERDQMRDPRA